MIVNGVEIEAGFEKPNNEAFDSFCAARDCLVTANKGAIVKHATGYYLCADHMAAMDGVRLWATAAPILAPRVLAYAAIDGERAYQEQRWNREPGAPVHTVAEWLVYLQCYVQQGMSQVTFSADPEASELALHTIRKIAAMGVACMEEHGAPKREGY
jgi:hypothetical protein